MGFARAQGNGRPGGFGSAQGTSAGFSPSQGAEGSSTPLTIALAGQSNAMGFATNNQTWSGGGRHKVRVFAKDYTLEDPAVDPIDEVATATDAVSDNGTTPRGHWILPCLTTLMPVINRSADLIPCAKDATAIAAWAPGADHQDRTTLYGAMVYRCLQYAAISGRATAAVLWWQGESDALAAVSKATYKAALEVIGDAVFADLGCPMIASTMMNTNISAIQQSQIDDAIMEVWGTHHVLAGPDLRSLATDDDYHALTDEKVASVAALWATALATALA